MFELDPRITEDSALLGTLPLCQVRLHRDARYPWVMLVPERTGIREIHAMEPADRVQLLDEIVAISQAMESALGAEKMNVAALGNICPQLHLHVIARYKNDDAWPGPIWGVHPPLEYIGEAWATRVRLLKKAFGEIEGFEQA